VDCLNDNITCRLGSLIVFSAIIILVLAGPIKAYGKEGPSISTEKLITV
jgi:hypothetical protein